MGNPYHDAAGKFSSSGAGRAVQRIGASTINGSRRVVAKGKASRQKYQAWESDHPYKAALVRGTAAAGGALVTGAIQTMAPGVISGGVGYTMKRAASNRSRYAYAASKGLGAVPSATRATRGVYKITKL